MGLLKRVLAEQAGPEALGILIPPGQLTILILRPRSLPWDLVLLRGVAEVQFREMSQLEARDVSEALFLALQQWNSGGAGQIAPTSSGQSTYQIWLDVGDFSLVVCARAPGQPYAPLHCASWDEASSLTGKLQAVLCPAPNRAQEIYFNSRHFQTRASG